jgi:hypothetical protein
MEVTLISPNIVKYCPSLELCDAMICGNSELTNNLSAAGYPLMAVSVSFRYSNDYLYDR